MKSKLKEQMMLTAKKDRRRERGVKKGAIVRLATKKAKRGTLTVLGKPEYQKVHKRRIVSKNTGMSGFWKHLI